MKDMLLCKALSGLMLITSLILPCAPSISTPPTPIYPKDYIGPYVACNPGIAVPVRHGERLHNSGATDILYFTGGQLVMDTFLQDPVRDADVVHFLGEMEVPGLGRVIRYELTSRNSDYRAIGYVYDTGKPYFTGHYQALFRSPQFVGTDADRFLLARVVSGAKAEAMCTPSKR